MLTGVSSTNSRRKFATRNCHAEVICVAAAESVRGNWGDSGCGHLKYNFLKEFPLLNFLPYRIIQYKCLIVKSLGANILFIIFFCVRASNFNNGSWF